MQLLTTTASWPMFQNRQEIPKLENSKRDDKNINETIVTYMFVDTPLPPSYLNQFRRSLLSSHWQVTLRSPTNDFRIYVTIPRANQTWLRWIKGRLKGWLRYFSCLFRSKTQSWLNFGFCATELLPPSFRCQLWECKLGIQSAFGWHFLPRVRQMDNTFAQRQS